MKITSVSLFYNWLQVGLKLFWIENWYTTGLLQEMSEGLKNLVPPKPGDGGEGDAAAAVESAEATDVKVGLEEDEEDDEFTDDELMWVEYLSKLDTQSPDMQPVVSTVHTRAEYISYKIEFLPLV